MQQIFKFTNKETDQIEEVQREKWRWIAMYNDGSELRQFDDATGLFHQLKEIEQSKLHIFKMVSDENPRGFQLLFNPMEMKLVHLYRNIVLDYMGKNPTRLKLYIFGYERLVQPGHLGIDWDSIDYSKNSTNENKIKNGRVYKNLTIIMPDGGVIITDDDKKVTIEPISK